MTGTYRDKNYMVAKTYYFWQAHQQNVMCEKINKQYLYEFILVINNK